MKAKTIAAYVSTAFAFCIPAAHAVAPITFSDKDKEVLSELNKGNTEEVQLGNLAKDKASHSSVRDFGNRMVKDHSRLRDQVQTLASREGISLAVQIGPKEQSLQADLAKLSGSDFDKRYIQMMLEDHQKDIAKLQDYSYATSNPDMRNLARKTLPIFENHIRIAEHVAGEIGVPPNKGLNEPEHPTE